MKNITSISEVKNFGFEMSKSQGGYFRLLLHNHLVIGDSACEDYYEEASAEAMFLEIINEDINKWLVIAKAIEEGWDGFNFNACCSSLSDYNYDGAYDYLLENLEIDYEMVNASGSWSRGTISYGDYCATGEFGPQEYLKWNEGSCKYEKSDKFNADYCVIEEIIYVDNTDVQHIALIDSYQY